MIAVICDGVNHVLTPISLPWQANQSKFTQRFHLNETVEDLAKFAGFVECVWIDHFHLNFLLKSLRFFIELVAADHYCPKKILENSEYIDG